MKKLVYILLLTTTFLTLSFNFSKLFDSHRHVHSNKEILESYLTNLVSFHTQTSNNDANQKALRWIVEQLRPLNLKFEYHQYNNSNSLTITTKNTTKPKVWLVAHIDVVSGDEMLFQAKKLDNKLYGRGVYDMKMAIACYMLLMRELGHQTNEHDIGIMITTDEETGGANGVKSLLQEGYSSDVAFLPDGGFDWKFEEMAKGVVQVKLTSYGCAAHGSLPSKGDNAINKLMSALNDINQMFEKEKSKDSSYYSTSNVGMITGGTAVNQVPDYAEACVDIRFTPEMTADQVLAKVVEITKKYDNVLAESTMLAAPRQVDVHQECFQKFSHLALLKYNIEVGSVFSHGASDARFFSEKDIPVLVIAPKGGQHHADKEWVDLDDLERFYEVMKAWVLEVS
ncbi:MAG: M20/M25/M40 family metallo-hydrolase [Parachlamydiales bacterium]|nr:M20/M25/M40 family metallo-hydrolase [Parachlamydiales bacterium]